MFQHGHQHAAGGPQKLCEISQIQNGWLLRLANGLGGWDRLADKSRLLRFGRAPEAGSLRQPVLDGVVQIGDIHRLGQITVHARFEAAITGFGQGIGGQGDDGRRLSDPSWRRLISLLN